jgi:hypothetical protein
MDIIPYNKMDSMVPKTIKTKSNIVIKQSTIDKELILHRTTALYGSPGAGKSYMIKRILYEIKDDIPCVVIISSTNKQNNAYTGISEFIITNPTISLVDKIITTQETRVNLWKYINDLGHISTLYMKCKNVDVKRILINEFAKCEAEIKSTISIVKNKISSISESERKIILSKLDDNIIDKYKQFIHKYREILFNNYSLSFSGREYAMISSIKMVPYMAIVFDDCVPFIAELNQKSNHKFTMKLLYTSRHIKITIIVASQSGKAFGPQFRHGFHNTIFCDSHIAKIFADEEKGKSSTKRELMETIEEVFDGPNLKSVEIKGNNQGSVKFKNPAKLIYKLEAPVGDKYSYMYDLDPEPHVVLGGAIVNNMCIKIKKIVDKQTESMQEDFYSAQVNNMR